MTASESRQLCYQLHRATLDRLGLVVAVRTFCREDSLQAGLAVRVEQHDVPERALGSVNVPLRKTAEAVA